MYANIYIMVIKEYIFKCEALIEPKNWTQLESISEITHNGVQYMVQVSFVKFRHLWNHCLP